MTALDHLKTLLELGCRVAADYGDWCFFCNSGYWDYADYYGGTPIEKHEPNCPYVAAKKFVEAQ